MFDNDQTDTVYLKYINDLSKRSLHLEEWKVRNSIVDSQISNEQAVIDMTAI